GDIKRETANTSSQSRESDAANSQFAPTHERIASCSTDLGTIRGEVLAHDRGVNDVFCRKSASTGYDSFTDRNRTFAYSFALDFGSAGPLDRPRATSPHPQMIVGGIDDGIHLGLADVSLLNLDRSIPYRNDHTLIIPSGILLEFAPMRWLASCFLLLFAPLTAAAWGEKGHLLVNRMAID